MPYAGIAVISLLAATPPLVFGQNAEEPRAIAEVMVDVANVRAAPSLSSTVIRTVPRGTQLTVSRQLRNWVQVFVDGDKRPGFIHASLVNLTISAASYPSSASSEGAVSTRRVAVIKVDVMAGPFVDAAILGTLPHSAPVDVLSETGSWVEIAAEGIRGYVHRTSLDGGTRASKQTVNGFGENAQAQPTTIGIRAQARVAVGTGYDSELRKVFPTFAVGGNAILDVSTGVSLQLELDVRHMRLPQGVSTGEILAPILLKMMIPSTGPATSRVFIVVGPVTSYVRQAAGDYSVTSFEVGAQFGTGIQIGPGMQIDLLLEKRPDWPAMISLGINKSIYSSKAANLTRSHQ